MKTLVFLVTLIMLSGADAASAQTAKAAGPRDLLRRVLELAKLGDLADQAVAEQRLGFRIVRVPKGDITEIHVEALDRDAFLPLGATYRMEPVEGQTWRRVRLSLYFETKGRNCVREEDFRSIFREAERSEREHRGVKTVSYSYSIQSQNEIRIDGFFVAHPCLFQLDVRQNPNRKD